MKRPTNPKGGFVKTTAHEARYMFYQRLHRMVYASAKLVDPEAVRLFEAKANRERAKADRS